MSTAEGTVGTHRRIRRTSVEGMIAERTREVSPSEVVSLWLGRVAAGHIATDQATAFAAARRWLDEIAATRPEARIYVARWRRILDAGPEAAMRVLTASDSESSALRGMSPFVAMLSETERRQVVRAAMVAAGTRS